MELRQIFLSYAGEDSFEALLLKDALLSLLQDVGISVWAFSSDQSRSQRSIGVSLKERVRQSAALIILISKSTLESGASQWMELGYADAFQVSSFVLLHHLTLAELKSSQAKAPPFVTEGHCTLAVDWRSLENELRRCLKGQRHD